eukprot:101739-Amphidinium_carterae.1
MAALSAPVPELSHRTTSKSSHFLAPCIMQCCYMYGIIHRHLEWVTPVRSARQPFKSCWSK